VPRAEGPRCRFRGGCRRPVPRETNLATDVRPKPAIGFLIGFRDKPPCRSAAARSTSRCCSLSGTNPAMVGARFVHWKISIGPAPRWPPPRRPEGSRLLHSRSSVPGSWFLVPGSWFIGSRFIGSRFIGSRFIGSRFIGSSVPGFSVPGSSVPGFSVPRFPVSRFPVPRFPVSRFPVPRFPVPRSPYPLAVTSASSPLTRAGSYSSLGTGTRTLQASGGASGFSATIWRQVVAWSIMRSMWRPR
jgi:hypothetical protein